MLLHLHLLLLLQEQFGVLLALLLYLHLDLLLVWVRRFGYLTSNPIPRYIVIQPNICRRLYLIYACAFRWLLGGQVLHLRLVHDGRGDLVGAAELAFVESVHLLLLIIVIYYGILARGVHGALRLRRLLRTIVLKIVTLLGVLALRVYGDE